MHDGLVHGVIVACYRAEDQKWLVIRRSEHVPAPLVVCFPGGTREIGETLHEAALREAREEVGLEVRLVEQVWTFDFDDKPLRLFAFLAVATGGEVVVDPQEVAEAFWLSSQEILDCPDVIENMESVLGAMMQAVEQLP